MPERVVLSRRLRHALTFGVNEKRPFNLASGFALSQAWAMVKTW
jgi:hypothetical protein